MEKISNYNSPKSLWRWIIAVAVFGIYFNRAAIVTTLIEERTTIAVCKDKEENKNISEMLVSKSLSLIKYVAEYVVDRIDKN